jgi:hypothetical protein
VPILNWNITENKYHVSILDLREVINAWLLPHLPISAQFIKYDGLIIGEFYHILEGKLHDYFPRAIEILSVFVPSDILSTFLYWFNIASEEIITNVKEITKGSHWVSTDITLGLTLILTTVSFEYVT